MVSSVRPFYYTDGKCEVAPAAAWENMGNAALKQHVVRLLEQHAPLVVKDLPYDELLALSVLGISVTLQRLELQERVLENLGIFLPLEIQSAWLEEVELSLRSGLHLHASAERLVLSVRLRDWDREVEAICQADAKKPWSNTEHAGQPFLLKLVSSFDVEVRNVEILCEMPDAESVPWTFGISTSACLEPLALKQILDPAQCWHAALILKDFRVRVAPSEVLARAARADERGLVVLCDEMRIQAHGSKRGGLPLEQTCGRQDAKLCMMLSVSGCAGLRISQQQLGMLFRLGHVFVLWDAFLRSLGTSMISAWMKDLEDLFVVMGQEPLTNAIFILDFGAMPVELILEDGHGSASGQLLLGAKNSHAEIACESRAMKLLRIVIVATATMMLWLTVFWTLFLAPVETAHPLYAPITTMPVGGAIETAIQTPSGMPHCEHRPTAAEQLSTKDVTVSFPLLGKRSLYWRKKDLPKEDKGLFLLEKVYKDEWYRQGVSTWESLNATFIVSKQQKRTHLSSLCSNHPRHQVFNHLHFSDSFTVKSSLASVMKNFARAMPQRAAEIELLLPSSFVLSLREDCHDFKNKVGSAMWIHKQDRTHNSNGVRLLTAQEAERMAANCGTRRPPHGLVQRYLPNPLLVAGHKCDFRVYLYVPTTMPFIALYSPVWYLRCGHQIFNINSTDPEMVVTNTKVHGKLREGANYSELVLGPDKLQQQLTLQGLPADFVKARLLPAMKSKLALLMEVMYFDVALADLETTNYELYGIDMMLDADLNLWLIEVNSSPGLEKSLGARKEAVEAILPPLVGLQPRAESAWQLYPCCPQGGDTPWQAMPPGLSKSLQVRPLSRADEDDDSYSDEESAAHFDLQLVCDRPPVLETRTSAQVVKAVGSAIHRVGSKFGIYDASLSPVPEDLEQEETPEPPEESRTKRLWRRTATTGCDMNEMKAKPKKLVRRRSLDLDSRATALTAVSNRGLGAKLSQSGLKLDSLDGGSQSSSVPSSTMQDLGLPFIFRRSSHHLNRLASGKKLGSLASLAASLPSSPQILEDNLRQEGAKTRASILDFEHLFVQYFVEVMPCRGRFAGRFSGEQRAPGTVRLAQPSAWEVAREWKEVLLDLLMQHKALILQHWPELQLTRKGLERRLNEELVVKDELSGPKSRVLLTLAPEQVCHRLLWALGDSIPTEVALKQVERRLQEHFPQSQVRCSDNWLWPASVIRTLFGITCVLLVVGMRSALLAALIVYETEPPIPGKKRKVDVSGPTWEELLDQLSARLILASSLGYLWLLYGIAAAFPLRSLHSPFQRDLGCLAAYSRTGTLLFRIAAPMAACGIPAAMAVRFDRLGLGLLVPAHDRPVGFHTAALAAACALPPLNMAAAWSIRSSLYSHHHFLMVPLRKHAFRKLGQTSD
ncbi:Protein polyglycylase TTLL10 [Symbiodinium microadriaticum]|uniref:Protein polyglycylase TTLL10 n=1 Tax=Symbiodinium microadriaticum TaxID=2951 RepID=A0A1Q9CM27_SYMMI|nr:Protein polyglycylase TTLL10 [Symbiodinium microadriaticum]